MNKKKNNKKKKRNKRLLYMFLLLFITTIMLATTTYAWFTANRIVSVDSLNVKVQSSGGIEISVDGTNWKTSVTQDDILGASATYGSNVNQLPEKFEPVSTGGITEGGYLKMFYGAPTSDDSGNYILTAKRDIEKAGTEGNFMAFDLFFKVDNASTTYLTSESSILYVGDNNPGSQNAFRVAFLDEGTTAIGSGLGSIQGLGSATDQDVYIWEPNSDTHSSTGISNAQDVYGISVSAQGASPIAYSGVINEINESQKIAFKDATSAKYPGYFASVDVDYPTSYGFSGNTKVWDFKAGITKMRVYIWLEGQDVDCENGASSGNLEIKFQLTTNPS